MNKAGLHAIIAEQHKTISELRAKEPVRYFGLIRVTDKNLLAQLATVDSQDIHIPVVGPYTLDTITNNTPLDAGLGNRIAHFRRIRLANNEMIWCEVVCQVVV